MWTSTRTRKTVHDDLRPERKCFASGSDSGEGRAPLAPIRTQCCAEAKPHLSLAIAQKLWAPVHRMLDATNLLEGILGKRSEAITIGLLL